MKYFLSLLLIVLLAGCNYTADPTASHISKQVKKCCNSLGLSADAAVTGCLACEETQPLADFSSSVFEKTGEILTW
jgi:hypothetical protein